MSTGSSVRRHVWLGTLPSATALDRDVSAGRDDATNAVVTIGEDEIEAPTSVKGDGYLLRYAGVHPAKG